MDTQSAIESVTKTEVLGLGLDFPSWDRPRSTEQLLGFIARREAAIAEFNDND